MQFEDESCGFLRHIPRGRPSDEAAAEIKPDTGHEIAVEQSAGHSWLRVGWPRRSKQRHGHSNIEIEKTVREKLGGEKIERITRTNGDRTGG